MEDDEDGYVRNGDDEYWLLNESDKYIWFYRGFWPVLAKQLNLSAELKRELYMCFEREHDGAWIKIPRTTWILLIDQHFIAVPN